MRHQRAIDRPTRDSYVRDNIRHSLHRKLENNEVKGEIVEQQGLLVEGQVGVSTPDCTHHLKRRSHLSPQNPGVTIFHVVNLAGAKKRIFRPTLGPHLWFEQGDFQIWYGLTPSAI
jgi:hypothetical protein